MAIATGTAMLIGSGIAAATQLGGGAMAAKSNRKSQAMQQQSTNSALLFERQKYEDEKKAAMEDRAYRNAIRKAWADKHGVDWSPSTGGTGTIGTLGGLKKRSWGPSGYGGPPAAVTPAGAEVAAAGTEMPPEEWQEWRG